MNASHIDRESRVLLRQGVDHYKDKDYRAALNCFDTVTKETCSTQILDLRAACLVELNELPAALKESKKTIQHDGKHPRGYLRAGQILQRMGRPGAAREIYAFGLRRAKPDHPIYDLLKKEYDSIEPTLSLSDCSDPLTVLPRELAVEVLAYLDFGQVTAISRVSKQWDRFIKSVPELWRHMDLSRARTQVTSAFVSKCVNVAGSKLSEVTLNKLNHFDKSLIALAAKDSIRRITLQQTGELTHVLVTHLSTAPNLQELRIGMGTVLTSNTVKHLLHTCGRILHTLEIPQKMSVGLYWQVSMPGLRTLNVVLNAIMEPPGFYRDLIRSAPHLESLTLQALAPNNPIGVDLFRAKHLTCVDLAVNRPEARYFRFPPSLRTLKMRVEGLARPQDFFRLTGSDPTNNKYNLPHLEAVELRIAGVPMETIMYGLQLRENSYHGTTSEHSTTSKLKSLTLVGVIPDEGFLDWSQSRLHDLEHLVVSRPIVNQSDDFLNSTVMAAVTGLHGLRSLDLTGTPIDGAGVKKIVEAGGDTLKDINLDGCPNVGRDAVDWARSAGISVTNRPDRVTSGRRVRY